MQSLSIINCNHNNKLQSLKTQYNNYSLIMTPSTTVSCTTTPHFNSFYRKNGVPEARGL